MNVNDILLIIQSDGFLFLETQSPLFEQARNEISLFAELIKSPEYVYTYRITSPSLWNAASSGLKKGNILNILEKYSKYPIPENIKVEIQDIIDRYGKIKLIKSSQNDYILYSKDDFLITEIFHNQKIKKFIKEKVDRNNLVINPLFRGHLKQELIKIGFPVEDLAGYEEGSYLDIELRDTCLFKKKPFFLRKYQKDASEAFLVNNTEKGGSGVVVLPCGAGKTIVGLKIMAELKTQTLILVANITAARQWIEEILDKTTLTTDDIGEYSGEVKSIKPVTIATYQILVYRKDKQSDFEHFNIFHKKNWGLIIYDEVHLLPAPVFRMAAELQSKRRLGLTATLIREDGKETDVFSLIGPKRYDVPWKVLEKQGWIAKAICKEIRIELPQHLRYKYSVATPRLKFKIASINDKKIDIIEKLIDLHKNDSILIIGQYIEQLLYIAEKFNIPFIYGKTKNSEREKLYKDFKEGKLKKLVVSKVANFAVDLPDANVAIQTSGTFGSRQEEAQRLGRILRPKDEKNQAFFYSIISKDTVEQQFAFKRQLFLVEQGYKYVIQQGF